MTTSVAISINYPLFGQSPSHATVCPREYFVLLSVTLFISLRARCFDGSAMKLKKEIPFPQHAVHIFGREVSFRSQTFLFERRRKSRPRKKSGFKRVSLARLPRKHAAKWTQTLPCWSRLGTAAHRHAGP